MLKSLSRSALLATVVALVLPMSAAAAGTELPVWGSVPSPNRGVQADTLLGLDVLAPDDIWAVGEYAAGTRPTTTRRTLAQHWDGTRWRLVPTPNPKFAGVDSATLEGVSGVAPDDVWAVGHGDDFSSLRSRTVIERWDGQQWRIVPSPNPAGANLPNRLFAVVALAADNVWAVGDQGVTPKSLVLHYDGSGWTVVQNTCGGSLRGITEVPGTASLWAVGENTTCFFDGQQWRRLDPAGFPDLVDVSASAPGNVWAVGFEVACDPFTCYSSSVIQRLVGARWVDVPHPLASELSGVYAAATDDVWAVGTNNVGTVIQHWDGAAWRDVPSPDPDGGGRLDAIDGLGSEELWAVGSFYTRDVKERTLVVQAPSTTQGQVVGDTDFSAAIVSWFGPVSGSTEADVFGNYDIAGLPAGDYLITATSPFGGCDPDSAEITVVAGETTMLNLQIDC